MGLKDSLQKSNDGKSKKWGILVLYAMVETQQADVPLVAGGEGFLPGQINGTKKNRKENIMQVTQGGVEEARRCALQSSVALIHCHSIEELEIIAEGLEEIVNNHADDYWNKTASGMSRYINDMIAKLI
jgi:hypothetical protein